MILCVLLCYFGSSRLWAFSFRGVSASPGEIGPGRAAGCHHAHLQHAGLSPGVPSARQWSLDPWTEDSIPKHRWLVGQKKTQFQFSVFFSYVSKTTGKFSSIYDIICVWHPYLLVLVFSPPIANLICSWDSVAQKLNSAVQISPKAVGFAGLARWG